MGNPPNSIPVMTLCLVAATLLLIGTASAAAPDAAFSSSTISGPAPLTVQFTDNSAGGPDGWAWFFGDETYDQAWTEANASSGWTKRYGHTSVVMPNGSIVLMGGSTSTGGNVNDVWLSTDNSTTWTVVNTSPGWSERSSHTSVVVGDSIVLMGGVDVGVGFRNDVWRSDDYGATWENITPQDPGDIWSARSEHTSVVMPDGSIVLMGGNSAGWKNDVWRSTDKGGNWTVVNASAEWPARGMHTSVVVGDSIVLMCGYNGANQNDVWWSDDYGATWVEVTPDDWWPERQQHTSVAMPDGSIILMGGYTTGAMNDVRRSTDKGATWTVVNADPGWPARSAHTSVAMPDGSIILMGGFDGAHINTARNDTWRLQPAGSNVQSPSHTYTPVGTYTVTLQAYNDDGYNVTRQVITVTAAVAPTTAFTANRTSGTVPLAVQFNDTSAGSPIVWNWSFGDGAWHNTTDAAERNATHTYAAVGTYAVSLTASNAVGSNTHTEADYITVSAAPVPPVANFTGTPTSGTAPLAVQFNDTSTGGPTSWAWDFGDGETSTDQNATHTYAAAGTYTVNLTVDNADGTDMLSRAGYITVTGSTPTVTPTVTPTSRPVYSGGGGGGSTGGPDGYNVGGDSAVSKVAVAGTGLKTFIITGWKQSSPGTGIPPAPGTPYQYVDLVPARFEEITGATITFTVPQTWLAEHGFAPEDIVLYHYNGTAWEALPTTVKGTAGTTVTFTAMTPGFSLFAISGIEKTGEAVTTPTATTPPATAEPTATETAAAPAGGPAPEFPLGTVALVAGIVLVLAGAGYLVRRWWIIRQNPALFRDYD